MMQEKRLLTIWRAAAWRAAVGGTVISVAAAAFADDTNPRAGTPIVLAQAGSIGGTIGKQGKSASGGEDAAPVRDSAAAKPRQAKSRTSADASGRAAGARFSIGGRWNWSGECQTGAVHYTGTMTFTQSGNTFAASHGGTNMWDNGAIANGRINGNRVSFDRTYQQYTDHIALTVSRSGGGLRMEGVLPNTAHSGRCDVSFVKNQ
jgi:hypothetical protein